MPIQKIIPKSINSLKPTAKVNDFKDIYVIQAIQDLLDTLKEKQRTLDIDYPNVGGGVGLASNQIDYPYEPVSDDDTSPKNGCYPKNFVPPNIYVVSIRQVRAALEKCEMVEPSVYINATFEPLLDKSRNEYKQSSYEEGCLSVNGFKGFNIKRHENIMIRAYNENGEQINFSSYGFVARVHQHELDHCLGKEYLNQINFCHNELENILTWINKHQSDTISDILEWVIKDKLKCTSKNPDFIALQTWTINELEKSRKNKVPGIMSRVCL